jgi:hypothetical protein
MLHNFKKNLFKNLSNIPGRTIIRKIVVFESDDWGSIRIKDKNTYALLKDKGLNVDAVHYDSVESLESNEDLEYLFELLSKFRDLNGNSPLFTGLCIMGNPDFDAIKDSNFDKYYFQPLHETIKEYPKSDNILELWKQGYSARLFTPELHGREHVNVRRFLSILKSHEAKDGLRFAFDHRSIGPSAFKSVVYPNYLGALYPETKDEIPELHVQLSEAGSLFKEYMGYSPHVFIAPNAEEPKELEQTLNKIGIKYITRSKRRIYPIGDGEFKKEWNFIGKRNEFDQIVLNRNAFFEPVSWGEKQYVPDWVGSCLNDIKIAFRWNKPVIISSHRVNYVGSINPGNRDKGLAQLKLLISGILKNWPDVEFMSSNQLGDCIADSIKK